MKIMERSEIYSQNKKAPRGAFHFWWSIGDLNPWTPTLPVWCAPNCANAPNGGDGENRSAHFCARRHARGHQNSPPDCFYAAHCPVRFSSLSKMKKHHTMLFHFGGDGENRTRVQNHLIKGSTSVVCLLSYPLS